MGNAHSRDGDDVDAAAASKRLRPLSHTTADHHFRYTGVHVDVLRDFVKLYPDVAARDINALVRTVVVPSSNGQSFAEHLLSNPGTRHRVKDRADVFICCPRSVAVATLIDSLEGFSGFVWMDALVLNQHVRAPVNVDFVRRDLPKILAKVGAVHVVASPWTRPAFASRTWCLYEIFTAMQVGARITLALPQREARTMQDAFERCQGDELHYDFFLNMFSALNLHEARASAEGDDEVLKGSFAGKSPAAVDKILLAAVLKWLVQHVEHYALEPAKTQRYVDAMHEAVAWLGGS